MGKDIQVHGKKMKNKPHPDSRYIFKEDIIWFNYYDRYAKEGILIEGVLYINKTDYYEFFVGPDVDAGYSQWLKTISKDIRPMPDFIEQMLDKFPSK